MKSIILIILLSLIVLTIIATVLVVNRKPSKNEFLTLSSPTPTPSPRTAPLKIKVSIPYWDQEKAVESFKRNADSVDIVSLFWYFLEANGDVKKYQYAKKDQSIIDFAHTKNIKVEIVITNLPEKDTWDSDRVKKVIRNDETRQKHISEIVLLAQTLGVDGVDIDYEQLDDDLADDFSKFIKELGSELDEKNKYLGVALHPKSDDGIGSENGSLAQNWQKLSQGADNLYIMAFGEHWDEGKPGPVASLPWVKRIVDYANNLGIDQNKLFLTIPLYGYAWQKDSDNLAKGLTYDDVTKLITTHQINQEWDESATSPHFHYKAGSQYEVWFENAKSVQEKINLANQAGFAGISFWRLGGEDPEVWKRLLLLKN